MEELHRQERSGARDEQIEREQDQQEQHSDSDFIESSERDIIEPAIDLIVDELQEIGGEEEVSLSVLNPTFNELADIEGENESYPPENNNDVPESDILFTENY